MKIGIITLQDEWMLRNYGSLLQLYALQVVLREAGHEPYFIRRRLNDWKWTPERFLKKLANVLRHPVRYIDGKIWKRQQAAYVGLTVDCFRDFFTKFICSTPRSYGEEELMKEPPFADCYIAGSDQVWSGSYPSTFLLFAEGSRRIAYAASCDWGRVDQRWKELARRSLSAFVALSVRENVGLDIIGGISPSAASSAVTAVDPVFLLGEEEWNKLAPPLKEDVKPYLLVYAVGLENEEGIRWEALLNYVHERGLGLKIVAIQGSQDVLPSQYIIHPTPQEFLNLFRQAEGVVTTSFHGTAFALLYHKPFLTFSRTGAGATQNGRFHTLLGRIGLSERLYSPDTSHFHVDWSLLNLPPASSAYELLEVWRKESLDFLLHALTLVPHK